VAIWSQFLGVPELGVDDTFLELGGHSVIAMQIASRVYDRFGVELPLESFFSDPTPRAIAATIDALRESDSATPLASGDRQP
jgi:acyl carrier protein